MELQKIIAMTRFPLSKTRGIYPNHSESIHVQGVQGCSTQRGRNSSRHRLLSWHDVPSGCAALLVGCIHSYCLLIGSMFLLYTLVILVVGWPHAHYRLVILTISQHKLVYALFDQHRGSSCAHTSMRRFPGQNNQTTVCDQKLVAQLTSMAINSTFSR